MTLRSGFCHLSSERNFRADNSGTAARMRRSHWRENLASATQSQALDERTVALDVNVLQVLEQTATVTDEQQQATA